LKIVNFRKFSTS